MTKKEHLLKVLPKIEYELPLKDLNLILEAMQAHTDQQLILSGVVSSAKNKDAIISEMKKMTDDERLDIITEFCKYCGGLDSGCQCWNDE